MKAYIMTHRTQITLEDQQYDRLRAESRRTGLALAELVRRAINQVYGTADPAATVQALEASFGTWRGRPDDGESYVEGTLRGMARRLAA
jgi:hypothetical protein